MRFRVAVAALALGISGGVMLAQGNGSGNGNGSATGPKVVVISLDAFGAESLGDPNLPVPMLHALMKAGSYARSMRPINPTVTWPNHTAMVSGVNASKHHIVVNGLVTNTRMGSAPEIVPHTMKDKLVAVPTVYDVAHGAGMVTAEVDWVAIEGASGITWRFSEWPNPDGPIEHDLIEQGTLTKDDLTHFTKPSQAFRDRMYTAAAVDIIKKHHPDLMLLHLLALDGIEHETGFGNNAGRNTMAFLDDRVKEVVEAVKAAGDLDRTTFLIVSDHGQETVHHQLRPNILLKQAGLQAKGAAQAAYCIPENGYGLVYQKGATTASVAALKALFAGKPGVAAALTSAEAAKDGWPVPSVTDQGPDLLLYAANGYSFVWDDTGQYVTDIAQDKGAHGFRNTEPLMQAIFIGSGAGIAAKGEIAPFDNVDVAATIAKLLHVELKGMDGKPLTAILK